MRLRRRCAGGSDGAVKLTRISSESASLFRWLRSCRRVLPAAAAAARWVWPLEPRSCRTGAALLIIATDLVAAVAGLWRFGFNGVERDSMEQRTILVAESILTAFALLGLCISIVERRSERRKLRTLLDEVRSALAAMAGRTSPPPRKPGAAVATSGVRPPAPAQLPEPPQPSAVVGLSAPFQPTQGQIEAARAAHEKQVLRARWEAEEDERERERARKDALNAAALRAAEAGNPEDDRRTIEIPPPAEHSDSDAGTQVFLASDRATMLGGVAQHPLRAAAAFLVKHAAPTLISAGITPRPGSAPMTDPIEARYEALCAMARAAGLPVDHCRDVRADCHHGDDAAEACLCSCDGCARATAYIVQAEREIMGPPQIDTPRSGRE